MENNDGLVKTENVGMGAIGAVIGSLAGVVAIILFDLIGFVASLAGVVMGYATLFMYEKLAKGISKKGVIICIVVMIVMVLVGENLAWSIAIAKELNTPVTDIFPNLYQILKLADVMGSYIGNLALVYLFTALGAFSIIKTKLELIKNS